MRLLTRPVRLIGLLVVVALIGLGAWLWLSAGSSTPTDAEAALRGFRARGGEAGSVRPGVPRPGVYTYRQQGSERGGAGPVKVSRDLPDEARYVALLTPEGFREELLVSEEHEEVVRYRVNQAGAIRAVWRRTEVRFVGVGSDDRRTIRPPSLHVPANPRVGQRWREDYRAGELRVQATSRVLRSERVTVSGRSYPVLVIRVDGVTSGAHPGTRTDVFWWSPQLSLPLRWSFEMDIGGTLSFEADADLRLAALPPKT